MKTGSTLEVPVEALELTEACALLEESLTETLPADFFTPAEPGGVFDAKGRVPVVVIRPGIGKGKGRHLYEADMLRENAHKFTGWKMYIDHQSPDARRAAGGLPRSVRDLGGRLEETIWWDGIPATDDHGQGAVVGLAKPVPFVRELVENDPQLVETSISAQATGVRPVSRGGDRVWLVEGIEDKGSLDWVTEAGAGGRVISLMESHYSESEGVDRALLEALSDDDFKTYIEENRPELLEAMKGKQSPPEGGDELSAKVEELVKKGVPRASAMHRARTALQEANRESEEDDVAEITAEQLQEAVAASPDILLKALTESSEAQMFISGLVEAKLDEAKTEIEEAAETRTKRVVQLAGLEKEAHRLIEASGLPETWRAGLHSEFELQESGEPTDGLDVVDAVDDDGKVEKTAKAVLTEAVEERIKAERERLAEANPTRVRAPGGGGSEPETGPVKSVKDTSWGRFLQESAGVDPDRAFALQGAGDDE